VLRSQLVRFDLVFLFLCPSELPPEPQLEEVKQDSKPASVVPVPFDVIDEFLTVFWPAVRSARGSA
jgi:hypothetical protein